MTVPDRGFRHAARRVDSLPCRQQDGNLPPDIAYPAAWGSRRVCAKIKVFAPRFCSENRGGFEKAAIGFALLGVAVVDANVIVRLMTSTPTTFRTLWWRPF